VNLKPKPCNLNPARRRAATYVPVLFNGFNLCSSGY